jgi:uncharacterized membrane protein
MSGTAKNPHPPVYWVYLYAIAWTGFILIATSLYRVFSTEIDYRWVALSVLTALVASRTLSIPGTNSRISISDIFVLTNLMLFGPTAGCISAAVDGFTGSTRCTTKSRRLEFVMFNTGNVAICGYLSGHVYSALHSGGPAQDPAALFGLLPAALALALSYYLLNSATVSIMLALESHRGIYGIWKENFLWLALNYLTGAFGAALLSHNGDEVTPVLLISIGCVVTIIYVSCRTILSRLAASAHS